MGKPKFQIQRDKDSETGKGLRSAGQACGYSEHAQIIPQLQIWKNANSYVMFPAKYVKEVLLLKLCNLGKILQQNP